MLPILWGGMWLWTRAVDRRSLRLGAAAGLLLGGDDVHPHRRPRVLAPLPIARWPFCWVADRRRLPTDDDDDPEGRRPLRGIGLVALIAAIPPAALGTFDLAVRSTPTTRPAAPRSAVCSRPSGSPRWPGSRSLALTHGWRGEATAREPATFARARQWLAWLLPAGATIIVLGLWLVRPHIQTAFTSTPTSTSHNYKRRRAFPCSRPAPTTSRRCSGSRGTWARSRSCSPPSVPVWPYDTSYAGGGSPRCIRPWRSGSVPRSTSFVPASTRSSSGRAGATPPRPCRSYSCWPAPRSLRSPACPGDGCRRWASRP